jgi:hypothetical protein
LDLKSNDHQLPLREDCEVTFHPSIPGFMRWIYSEVHMLLVKEKWEMYI